MAFLQLQGISLAFGDRDILRNVGLNLTTNTKIALAGDNGSGKSTLLKIIAGKMKPDSGDLIYPKKTRIGYLAQTGIEHHQRSLWEEAEEAFSHLELMVDEKKQVEYDLAGQNSHSKTTDRLLERQHELEEAILQAGYYERSGMIERVLLGLGFSRNDFKKDTADFSSGWQMRIALARTLLEHPDVMLLDEPTNYLDIETIDWLKDFLRNYKGSLLLVSHDQFFLDAVVNEVAELFTGRLLKYRGNYSQYKKTREGELEQLIRDYTRQQEQIAKLEEFINRFRYNASKASLVQSRIKTLEKIEPIVIPESLKKIHFSFPPPPHCGKQTLQLSGLCHGYDNKTVFKDLDLNLERGEKITICGVNGAGKSTLLRLLSGAETPDSGEIRFGTDVKIGFFSQESAAFSEEQKKRSIIQELEQEAPTDKIPQLRNLLGAFLFRDDDIHKPLGVLSGGEQNRVALIKLLLRPVNMLILDEPTNHLDINSKEILLKALNEFTGTIIFVSHDHHFIQGLATQVLELKDHQGTLFVGDYEYYRWKTDPENSLSASEDQATSKAGSGPSSAKEVPQKVKSSNQLTREEQKKQKALKKRLLKEEEDLMIQLDDLSDKLKRLNHSLADPEIYTNGEKVREINTSISASEQEQEELTERWETVTEELSRLEEAD